MGKEYDEILTKIKVAIQNAAARGDPVALLESLSQEKAISGLVSRLSDRWQVIEYEDLSDIICFAIDALFYHVRAGKSSSNPMGFLWKTADFKAHEYYRRAKRSQVIEDFDEILEDKTTGHDLENLDAIDLDEREMKRAEAIRIARLLLPRVKSQNIQNVMGYVIDAVERGVDNIENQQIADAFGLSLKTVRDCLHRGFNRLSELALQENIIPQPFDFLHLKDAADTEDEFEEISE
jgi:DNA-directed RNA polymerase specialized sigma24 family protein